MNIIIHPIQPQDTDWVNQALINLWGSTRMVTRGKLFDMTGLDGFIAYEGERKVGLITYVIARQSASGGSAAKQSQESVVLGSEATPESRNVRSWASQDDNSSQSEQECEIISLNSLTPGKGIGSMLFSKVEEEAKKKGVTKIITQQNEATNDFFLKQGFQKHNNNMLEYTL